jgi:Flp pilus assembly protein TadG
MKKRLRSERGAELIEFAMIFPVLLLVMLGIVDFGFMFQRYEVLTNAAREGARMAVLPGYATPDVEARVRSYVTTGGVPTRVGNPTVAVLSCSIPVAAGAPLTAKRVTVSYTHSYLFVAPIAAMFGDRTASIPLTAVAIMRDELAGGGGGAALPTC